MTTPTALTTATTPTRRGRPPGTGWYTNQERFLSELASACSAVSETGALCRRNPRAIDVAVCLDTISVDTMLRRLHDCGFACWADWLAHWQRHASEQSD